jgi:hypothetical protein
MTMVGFPLLLIPLAVYNIIAFLMPGVSLTGPLFTLPLPSGSEWPVTLSDLLLTLAIVLLLLEVIKGARPGAKYLTDHLLSLIISGGAIAEFLLLPRFASSTFFLLTLLTVTDFLTGVSLRARRAASAPAGGHDRAPAAREVGHEGDVQVMPQAPAPTHHAEVVGHHEPAGLRSGSEAVASSPEEMSPGLQPENGSPRPPETPR